MAEPGSAGVAREGSDATMAALAATVPPALAAAEQTAAVGVSAKVIVLRCLMPLDTQTVLWAGAGDIAPGHCRRNPYQGGWGSTAASIAADEGFEFLDAPIRRVAAACAPLPFADVLQEALIPATDKAVTAIRAVTGYRARPSQN